MLSHCIAHSKYKKNLINARYDSKKKTNLSLNLDFFSSFLKCKLIFLAKENPSFEKLTASDLI